MRGGKLCGCKGFYGLAMAADIVFCPGLTLKMPQNFAGFKEEGVWEFNIHNFIIYF